MITLEQVTKVYSGKPGCMCGCLGKYYEAGSAMAKKVVRLINEHNGRIEENGEWAEVQIGQREYVAYLAVRS